MLKDLPDERLVTLMRNGREAALDVLCVRYRRLLIPFARNLLGDWKEDAEDVVQECLVSAYKSILADRRVLNLKPWLYQVVRNRSLNHRRNATSAVRPPELGVDTMDEFFSAGLSVEDRVISKERTYEVLLLIRELTDGQTKALILREFGGLTYAEIGTVMALSESSVKSLLSRARITLQSKFGELEQ